MNRLSKRHNEVRFEGDQVSLLTGTGKVKLSEYSVAFKKETLVRKTLLYRSSFVTRSDSQTQHSDSEK